MVSLCITTRFLAEIIAIKFAPVLPSKISQRVIVHNQLLLWSVDQVLVARAAQICARYVKENVKIQLLLQNFIPRDPQIDILTILLLRVVGFRDITVMYGIE